MSLADLKDKISQTIDGLQDQAQSAWANFSKRERIILGSAAGLFAVALLALALKFLGGFISGSQFDSAKTMKEVHEIQKLISELKSLKFKADQFDRKSKQKGEKFTMTKHIEDKAKRFRVTVKGVKPTRATSSLTEEGDELFEVQLASGSSLDDSLRFLDAVEDPIGVRIISMSMKPNFTDPSKFDVKFRVAHTKEL
jgi:hypothetical protein